MNVKKIIVGLILAILTAVILWPSYALKGQLEALTGGRLKIINTSGSIWSGRATLGLSDEINTYQLPGELTWSPFVLRNGYLVGFSIQYEVLSGPVQVGLVDRAVQINGGEAFFPAVWLGALGAPFNTIRPEGQLQVNWQAFTSNIGQIDIDVTWLDAQSALTNVRPLGQYNLTVQGELQNQVLLNLSTESGPLNLEGQGLLQPGKDLSFEGYAWAREDSKLALKGLLSQIGRLENGKYRLGIF